MNPEESDEQILDHLRDGNEVAFTQLYSRHRPRLKRMLEFRMDPRLRGREDASDILQELFLDARLRMRHYLAKPEMSFFVWLRRLALQRLTDQHRRHLKASKRDARQEVSLYRPSAATSASMASLLVEEFASPSQAAVRAEMIGQVEAALERMDAVDREILALRHFEELRNAEVAEVLGLKEAAASNRYIRALGRLRDALENIPGFFDEL